jgi:hypothetical protein
MKRRHAGTSQDMWFAPETGPHAKGRIDTIPSPPATVVTRRLREPFRASAAGGSRSGPITSRIDLLLTVAVD